MGHSQADAHRVVEQATEMRNNRPGSFSGNIKQKYSANSAGRNMLIGGAVFVVGLMVTFGYTDESGRGRIAIGAIIWGAIQFCYGLVQWNQSGD
jgi:hypothetical protein